MKSRLIDVEGETGGWRSGRRRSKDWERLGAGVWEGAGRRTGKTGGWRSGSRQIKEEGATGGTAVGKPLAEGRGRVFGSGWETAGRGARLRRRGGREAAGS